MKQIAIIDDDIYIGDMLEEVLRREGYGVWRAYSGTEALLLVQSRRPNLVLLDLMLPGLSGEEVLPKLEGIPVIVLSAKGDVQEKVGLLLGGAADYMTKPFDTRELLARIAVQLRRSAAPSPLLRCGSLTLDAALSEYTFDAINRSVVAQTSDSVSGSTCFETFLSSLLYACSVQ